ncbi:MAG TPA: hypothetical protein DCQ04_13385 [Actinobacteria bacterium]|nr:hypothetical protein [Actinomycetota bacterium]
MSKADRQYRTNLNGQTALPVAQVFELARQVGGSTKAGGMKLQESDARSNNELIFEMRSTGMSYFFRGINASGEQGRIVVAAVPVASAEGNAARTDILVHLDGAYTTRTAVVLVPVTPKTVVGFDAFQSFLTGVEAAIRREDQTAQIRISDSPPN